MACVANMSAWNFPIERKMGYDTMSAWDRTAFEFNDQIQQRCVHVPVVAPASK